ncbi:unnamed protein product, partial [Amoebophrya sp. A25]
RSLIHRGPLLDKIAKRLEELELEPESLRRASCEIAQIFETTAIDCRQGSSFLMQCRLSKGASYSYQLVQPEFSRDDQQPFMTTDPRAHAHEPRQRTSTPPAHVHEAAQQRTEEARTDERAAVDQGDDSSPERLVQREERARRKGRESGEG